MAPCRPRRLVCTGTVLHFYYTFLPGTCATCYQYSSTRLHVTMAYETAPSTAVQASHEHDHNSHLIFRPRLTLARLSPLRCLSGLRRCSHICKALHPPTALPRVALVRTGDLRPQTDRAALSLPDFGDGTHLVAADGALRRAHAPPAGLLGARYGAHRKVRRATGAHALVPTWQE